MKIASKLAAVLLGASALTALAAVPAHAANCVPKDAPAAFTSRYPTVDMCWEHPGANRAFKSPDAAMVGREAIFAQFRNADGTSWSPELVAAAMAATQNAPHRVMIVRWNFFNDMAEHGRVDHNVAALFMEAIHGITEALGGLFLWADMWEFDFHGVHYKIYLPEICFNWADRRGPPPPPQVTQAPPAPHDDCVVVAWKVNEGDVFMGGVTAPQDLPPSPCTAQKLPGETAWETNFQQEPCPDDTDCSLENPAHDLGQPLLSGMRETFVPVKNGYYFQRFSREAIEQLGAKPIGCEHHNDGHRSWGQYVEATNFTAGMAVVVFHVEKAPPDWAAKGGQPLERRFQPFYGEPNHR